MTTNPIPLVFYSTSEYLPVAGFDYWILGWGGASSHVEGKWDIFHYDGNWWWEGGTEMISNDHDIPKQWCYLPKDAK